MSSMNPATMPLSDLAELIAAMKGTKEQPGIVPATVTHPRQLATLEMQLALAYDAGKYSVIEDLQILYDSRKEQIAEDAVENNAFNGETE